MCFSEMAPCASRLGDRFNTWRYIKLRFLLKAGSDEYVFVNMGYGPSSASTQVPPYALAVRDFLNNSNMKKQYRMTMNLDSVSWFVSFISVWELPWGFNTLGEGFVVSYRHFCLLVLVENGFRLLALIATDMVLWHYGQESRDAFIV